MGKRLAGWPASPLSLIIKPANRLNGQTGQPAVLLPLVSQIAQKFIIRII